MGCSGGTSRCSQPDTGSIASSNSFLSSMQKTQFKSLYCYQLTVLAQELPEKFMVFHQMRFVYLHCKFYFNCFFETQTASCNCISRTSKIAIFESTAQLNKKVIQTSVNRKAFKVSYLLVITRERRPSIKQRNQFHTQSSGVTSRLYILCFRLSGNNTTATLQNE